MQKSIAASLMTPALLVTFLFLIAPLGVLFYISLRVRYPLEENSMSLGSYQGVLTDSYYLNIMVTTVGMAFAVTALALFFAIPVAHFLARTQSRFKSVFLMAVILPLFVGNAVRAIGWMLALGERGVVNTVSGSIGLGVFEMMFTWKAVLIGAAAVNLPYMILTLQSVIEQINPSVEEASVSLGATPTQTWRLITLPLMMPGLIAACTLSFILSMNAYATPVLLGGPKFRMMGPTIANEIILRNNWSTGAALAFVLIAVTIALTLFLNRFVLRSVKR